MVSVFMRQRILSDEGHEKQCSKCELVKPLGHFSRDKHSKDGYRSDCKVCHSRLWKPYSEQVNYQVTYRGNHLLRTYGLTSDQYQALYDQQQGCCAACGRPETVVKYGKLSPLAVDHCHSTGAVRGLLCSACNRALGLLGEDPERIEALLRYIREKVL